MIGDEPADAAAKDETQGCVATRLGYARLPLKSLPIRSSNDTKICVTFEMNGEAQYMARATRVESSVGVSVYSMMFSFAIGLRM